MFEARDKVAKERYMETFKEGKREVIMYMNLIKEKLSEKLGRKMNQDVRGNKKLFWRGVKRIEEGLKVAVE